MEWGSGGGEEAPGGRELGWKFTKYGGQLDGQQGKDIGARREAGLWGPRLGGVAAGVPSTEERWRERACTGLVTLSFLDLWDTQVEVSRSLGAAETLAGSQSVQFSHSVVFDSLQPHGLQHASLPCPSPTPRACSNSCPSSR